MKSIAFTYVGINQIGELIRSIDYGKVRGDAEDHPTSNLKYLKGNCSDLTFGELTAMFPSAYTN